MSKITRKYITAGDTADAAFLNAPYDALATDTVDGYNTADKWANRDYINEIGPDINKLYHDYNNGATPFSTSSTTLTQVVNGADVREINPNYTCANDVILRVWADGTTGIPTWENRDFSGGSPWQNLWQVAISVTYNTTFKRTIEYGNWSFSPWAMACTAGAPAAAPDTINYRNFALSGITLFNPGDVINKIELLAKVGDAGNTLVIGRNNLFAVIVEN